MVTKEDFKDVVSVLEDGDARSIIRAMIDECDMSTVYHIFDVAMDCRRNSKLSEMRILLTTIENESIAYVLSLGNRVEDPDDMTDYMTKSQIKSSVEHFRNVLEIYDMLGRRSDMYDFLSELVPIYEDAAEESRRYSEDYLAVSRRIARAIGSEDPFMTIYVY